MSRAKTVTINRKKIKELVAAAGISQRQLSDRIGLFNPQSLNNALSQGRISERLADLIGVVLDCWPEYFTDQILREGLPESMDVPHPYSAHFTRLRLLSLNQISEQLLSYVATDTDSFTTEEIEEFRNILVMDTVEFYTSRCPEKA